MKNPHGSVFHFVYFFSGGFGILLYQVKTYNLLKQDM